MQVHTFIAESANEAVERIRGELGPSAVVLSVRKLPRTGLERFLKQDQIEVLAGIEEAAHGPAKGSDPIVELREEIRQLRRQVAGKGDSDSCNSSLRGAPSIGGASYTSAAGGPGTQRKPSGIARVLNQTGLLPQFSELIVQEMAGGAALPIPAQIELASELLRRRWRGEEPCSEASVHIFVGAPGCGKSTVLCKMLAQTSLVEGQPATVYQLDSHVANTSPQPGVYAEIVGAQFERIVPLNFERREESVYVDLPGVALQSPKALARLRDLMSSFGVPEVHLVLNAAYESAHLLEQVRFFSSLGISDLIVTHLDEESRWGKIWNLVLGTNYCVRSLGYGQNVPGDFCPANPEVILSRQFRGN